MNAPRIRYWSVFIAEIGSVRVGRQARRASCRARTVRRASCISLRRPDFRPSVRRGPRAETLRPIIKRFGDEIGQCVKLVAEIVRGGMSGSPHLSIEDVQS
jgi:hypothetical protein